MSSIASVGYDRKVAEHTVLCLESFPHINSFSSPERWKSWGINSRGR